MTRLPPPEQWVLSTMNEMEVAEMIEEHIELLHRGQGRQPSPGAFPTPFVRHFMKRSDGALPTVVAIATAPIVLADGGLLAPEGLDRLRGIQFIIQDELRAILPKREDCTEAAVKAAMKFSVRRVAGRRRHRQHRQVHHHRRRTDHDRALAAAGPAVLLRHRRAARRRKNHDADHADHGRHRGAAGSGGVVDQRGGASQGTAGLLPVGVPYILWDNIARGTQISCPHIEKSCTSAYYADRKLGVSEMVSTAASTIHLFTGNNIGAKGDLASRSLHIRLDVDRADPENRTFVHPDPIGWTENHRAEILAALYTILLGNPQLKATRDAAGKTRFKMWWRLVGSAVENAAKLTGHELDFQKLFIAQEEDDEESASLADMLEVLVKKWPGKQFMASAVAGMINDRNTSEDRPDRARLSVAGRPGRVHVLLGKGRRQVAEKAHRRAGSQRRAHARAAPGSSRHMSKRIRIAIDVIAPKAGG